MSQSGRWLPLDLSGWDYRQIVAGFFKLQHQEFLGGLPSKYYPGPTILSVIGRMVVKRIAKSF